MPISRQELDALDSISRRGDGEAVLSVYLDLEPSRNVTRSHVPALTALLRTLRERLDASHQPGFDAEAERCLAYMRDEFQPAGRTLIIFSSLPRDLWTVLQVQAVLPGGGDYGPRPYLLPLSAEPTLERRAIVTIDSANARILTSVLGELEMERSLQDYVPRGSRQLGRKHQRTGAPGDERAGGTPSFREDTSLDEWVAEHYRNVVAALEELHETHPFERLALGGTQENLSRLVEMLPGRFAAMVSGSFAADPEASTQGLVDQAAGVFRHGRAQEDRESVRQAQDQARAGGTGAMGWDETLTALQQGRVMRLLLPPGTGPGGYACEEGHYAGSEDRACPYCGKRLQRVLDLAAYAAGLARDTGAEVRLLEPEAVEELGESGVAAVLRY